MTSSDTAAARAGRKLFSALVGLTTVAIFLQAVWAGLFIRAGKNNDAHWVDVHARGAEVAIALSVAALIVAVWKLRTRRDLVIGSAGLAVLLIVEAYIGGIVYDHQTLEVIHFPLALALVALAVWLPLRARVRR